MHVDKSFDNADPSGKETYAFLERFGKEGGGKGILVSHGFCPTLTGTTYYVCVEEIMKENEEKKIGVGNFPVLHNCQLWDNVENDLSPCLRARGGTGGNSVPMFLDEDKKDTTVRYVVRRITPREAERLQGFPDDYTDIPWKDGGHAPDSHRYKALGNSFAVPVVRWIAQRIDDSLAHPIKEDTSEPIWWQPELF